MTKEFFADRAHVDLTDPSVDPATAEAELAARVREVAEGQVELVPLGAAWREIFGTELPAELRSRPQG